MALVRYSAPGESQHDMARSILQDGRIENLLHELTPESDSLRLSISKTDGKYRLDAEIKIIARRGEPGRLDFEILTSTLRVA